MLEAVFPGRKRVDVKDGKFLIQTDQKQSNGGDATAPEPFDVFLSSILACAGIYAKSFCDTRGLSSDRLKLEQEVTFDRSRKMLRQVSLTLYVAPDFPGKYEKSILKAMNSCTVKRHLHPDIEVETKLLRLSEVELEIS